MSSDPFNDETPSRRERRQQWRWAGKYIEPLLEDARLRDNLGDDVASRLMDWGVERLEGLIIVYAGLPLADAEQRMQDKASLVTMIVRYVNVVMGEHAAQADPSEQQLRQIFSQLLTNLYALSGKRTNPYQVKRAIRIAKSFAQLESQLLFAELMAMVENTRDVQFPPNDLEV